MAVASGPMAQTDLTKAAERFLFITRRMHAGLTLQHERLQTRTANAPRLLPNSPYEGINYGADPGIDLDYYVWELGRLRAAADSSIKVADRAGGPSTQPIVDALLSFDRAIPKLK